MSAYVVRDETINIIVTFIFDNNRQYNEKYYYTLNPLRELHPGFITQEPGFDQPDGPGKLGNALFKLNCDSVEGRYGKGQAKEFRPLDYKYKRGGMCNVYKVLAAMSDWLYQSCEGGCENDPLYQAIDRMQGNIALSLIKDTAEYQAAQ